jgi:hypothetical protein
VVEESQQPGALVITTTSRSTVWESRITTTRFLSDRIVHHADVLTLKGTSYRLRGRGIDSLPSIRTQNTTD